MNIAVFRKTVENVQKHRDIKLAVKEGIISCRNLFFEKAIRNTNKKKSQVVINKPIYPDLPILERSIIVMYKFWYDYVEPKFRENLKLCCMDTDSVKIYVKAEDIHIDISKDVEEKFNASSYEWERLLQGGKNTKLIGLVKNHLYLKA